MCVIDLCQQWQLMSCLTLFKLLKPVLHPVMRGMLPFIKHLLSVSDLLTAGNEMLNVVKR